MLGGITETMLLSALFPVRNFRRASAEARRAGDRQVILLEEERARPCRAVAVYNSTITASSKWGNQEFMQKLKKKCHHCG